ncbi:hypothetical protein ACFL16_03015 [Patescibacteria group bacterium]
MKAICDCGKNKGRRLNCTFCGKSVSPLQSSEAKFLINKYWGSPQKIVEMFLRTIVEFYEIQSHDFKKTEIFLLRLIDESPNVDRFLKIFPQQNWGMKQQEKV